MAHTTLEPVDLNVISTAIEDADAEVLANCITELRRTKASIVRDILTMGEHLANARDALEKYGSKAFNQFLNSDEVQISRRSAEEYMYAYGSFADLPEELTYLFCARAVYRLSAPSAPEDAPDAAIEKARQGIRINERAAREIVQELTPQTEPTEPEPLGPWNEPQAGEDTEPGGGLGESAEGPAPPTGVATVAKVGEPALEPEPETFGAERQVGTRVPVSEPEAAAAVFDRAGHQIGHLPEIASVFEVVEVDWTKMLDAQEIARKVCSDLIGHPAGEGLVRVGAESDLKRMVQKMQQLRPYSVCPKCEGAGCKDCGDRGWVNKNGYLQSFTKAERAHLAEKLKDG